jgi:hypothetical protein
MLDIVICQLALEHASCVSETSQVHDLCALLKRFLRELPGGLLNDLYTAFMQTVTLSREDTKQRSVLLICQLLPVDKVTQRSQCECYFLL